MAQTFVAEFVRDLVVDETRSDKMITSLEKKVAYIQQDYLAITTLGKVSSEMITQTVGKYLHQVRKIIDVVSMYGGDIVKFLGDAILVTFQADPGDITPEFKVILRATMCCVHILRDCSQFEVPLDAIGSTPRLPSRDKKTMLYLHIALTAGKMSRVVMGLPSERLDYSVYGPQLSILGKILDGTSPGELGIDNNVWAILFENHTVPFNIYATTTREETFIRFTQASSKILSASLQEIFKIDPADLQTKDRLDSYIEHDSAPEHMLAKFINQSIWKKLLSFRAPKLLRRRTTAADIATPSGRRRSMAKTSLFGSEGGEDNETTHSLSMLPSPPPLSANPTISNPKRQKQPLASIGLDETLEEGGEDADPNVTRYESSRRGSGVNSRSNSILRKLQMKGKTASTSGMFSGEAERDEYSSSTTTNLPIKPSFISKLASVTGIKSTSDDDLLDDEEDDLIKLEEKLKASLQGGVSVTGKLSSKPTVKTMSSATGQRYSRLELQDDEIHAEISNIGEFRTVTIVFAKLHFDFDKRISQRVMVGFLNCLKRHEGFFQQFSIDDKGQTLLAIFGLPPLAHTSEPEPAVRAMIEFSELIREEAIGKISIGIST
ncbi:Adenylate cyclase type 10, partial [Blyttiomyces sp. JEL0837]